MTVLKILIIGGGVAGTSLAFWLVKLGYDVTVVERFPSLRTTGLQIDLRGHGIEVLRRMGLEKAFRDKAALEEGLQFVDSRGRKRAYFAANKSGKGAQSFTSEFEIMRGDLCRLIYNATGKQVKYIFGTSVASYKEDGDAIEVVFKNGTTDRFDLMVGADGVYSATRKMMLGPDSPDAFHSIGESVAYLTIPRPIQEGERYIGTMYMATKKRSILIRRHSPEMIQLYLLLNREEERLQGIRRGDVEEEKVAFREIFQDAGWLTADYLEAIQDSKDFYCERVGLIKMDSWSQGRVALLGDAAYGPGGSGMGTTCAMVGAYILAGEIGKYCGDKSVGNRTGVDHAKHNIAKALKEYDTKFRPFMDQVQAGLDNANNNWFLPSTAFGIMIFHWIAELIAILWIDRIAQLFVKETVKNWEFPDYEEMLGLTTKE